MPTALKDRWNVHNNFPIGLTLDAWWRLLQRNRISPAYWHRAAFITLATAMNSIQLRQERKFDDAVRATELKGPPLFILGHWRSGTTHLHNLISQDTTNFAFANTYQVLNPLTFLYSEEVNSQRFGWLVSKKRLMDDVALSFSTPQEDEFALCLMTLCSPYMGNCFPQLERHYNRYISFEGVPQDEVQAWKQSLLWFCKKLTLKHGRPLVLKSPPHTARIRLLLELFPDARFVHIHRHPHAIFRSMHHYRDTAFWHNYLQVPDLDATDDLIVERYRSLYDAYFAQRDLIPPGRFHELSFADLEQDPVGQLKELYRVLAIPDFATFEPMLKRYLGTLKSYRKNAFRPLEGPLREPLAHAWAREFAVWGYEP